MNLRQAENIVHSYLMIGKSLDKAPRLVRRALEVVERKEQATSRRTPREQSQLPLLAHEELTAKGEGYKRRAAAREALADYLENAVIPARPDCRVRDAAERLRDARRAGTWGMRGDGSIVTIWDDKSGLVRLDPDEAREESQRLAERYAPHLVTLAKQGKGLHYMVATVPNVAPGDLAAAKKKLFKKWSNFLRKERAGQKAFPEILGSLVVMEDPLSAHDDWNIHLNIFLVTARPFHEGLYEKIRRLWAFNIHMQPVKGNPGEVARAFNEILKYSARVVPEKSADKSNRHHTDAPAMTQWSPDRFCEWFDAQTRFRRTRTYGCLYGNQVPHPEPEDQGEITWLGTLRCSGNSFTASPPLIEFIPGDKFPKKNQPRTTAGPP